MDSSYKKIASHYKQCFSEYGDTPQGYDWSNEKDMQTRYITMMKVIENFGEPTTLLDFGCGAGGFYKYIRPYTLISYTGIDINKEAIEAAREKYLYLEKIGFTYNNPNFGVLDIHNEEDWEAFNNPKICLENYDYIIMNGVFTVRGNLSQNEMSCFLCDTLDKLWSKCNKGIAFNLMSNLVDWKRDDLYHVSMDEICQYLVDNFSRNFIVRNDYNLYEYTIYLYKNYDENK